MTKNISSNNLLLENLSILWINYDKNNQYNKNIFDLNDVEYNKINASNDSIEYIPSDKLKYIPNYIKEKDYQKTCGHLKTLKFFLENIDDNICLVCEDNLSLKYLKYWIMDIHDYIQDLQKKFDLLELTDKKNYNIEFNVDDIVDYNFNAQCYIITKNAAKNILCKFNVNKDVYDFSKTTCKEQIFMNYINVKNEFNIYNIPLFTCINIDVHNKNLKQNIEYKWYYNGIFNDKNITLLIYSKDIDILNLKKNSNFLNLCNKIKYIYPNLKIIYDSKNIFNINSNILKDNGNDFIKDTKISKTLVKNIISSMYCFQNIHNLSSSEDIILFFSYNTIFKNIQFLKILNKILSNKLDNYSFNQDDNFFMKCTGVFLKILSDELFYNFDELFSISKNSKKSCELIVNIVNTIIELI